MGEGCGKSSFLHVVAGLEDTTEGSVTFDGLALTEPSPERSLIFQEAALYPRLTVREQNWFVSEADEDFCRRLPPRSWLHRHRHLHLSQLFVQFPPAVGRPAAHGVAQARQDRWHEQGRGRHQ